MIKTKKSYIAALQNRQFSHDPSFYGSIATGLMVVAPLQNATANHPSTHRSIAQFCRDLQVKDNIIKNREEIPEFAIKNQCRFHLHEFSQRGPANGLQYISQSDHKMTARLRNVFRSCRLRTISWIMRSRSPQACPMGGLPMDQISV